MNTFAQRKGHAAVQIQYIHPIYPGVGIGALANPLKENRTSQEAKLDKCSGEKRHTILTCALVVGDAVSEMEIDG